MPSLSHSLSLPFQALDVFTTDPFKGNPLAIVHLPHHPNDITQSTKQAIAREFNYSETVFLHDPPSLPPPPDAAGSSEGARKNEPPRPSQQQQQQQQQRRFDIFTPTEELPFAGHPTIGTIWHICHSATQLPLESVHLLAKAGPIAGHYDVLTGRASALIPQDVHVHDARVPPDAVLTSQQVSSAARRYLHEEEEIALVSIVKGMSFILVPLLAEADLDAVEAVRQRIDFEKGVRLDEGWGPSFIGVYYYTLVACDEPFTTAATTTSTTMSSTRKVKTRMMEPRVGEDAATGSAASALAAYLALQSGGANAIHEYEIEQGVQMGRASQIYVKVWLDDRGTVVVNISLAGNAVAVSRGVLQIPT